MTEQTQWTKRWDHDDAAQKTSSDTWSSHNKDFDEANETQRITIMSNILLRSAVHSLSTRIVNSVDAPLFVLKILWAWSQLAIGRWLRAGKIQLDFCIAHAILHWNARGHVEGRTAMAFAMYTAVVARYTHLSVWLAPDRKRSVSGQGCSNSKIQNVFTNFGRWSCLIKRKQICMQYIWCCD